VLTVRNLQTVYKRTVWEGPGFRHKRRNHHSRKCVQNEPSKDATGTTGTPLPGFEIPAGHPSLADRLPDLASRPRAHSRRARGTPPGQPERSPDVMRSQAVTLRRSSSGHAVSGDVDRNGDDNPEVYWFIRARSAETFVPLLGHSVAVARACPCPSPIHYTPDRQSQEVAAG
jgi:hypothetical protein